MKKIMLEQILKYGIVGLGNTLITAIVIALLMKGFNSPELFANGVGYVAGLVNSFIWNKKWTFKNSSKWRESAIKFFAGFFVCYLIQLCFVAILNRNLAIDHYYNHLAGMVVYTVLNFIINKYVIFKNESR